MELFYSEEYEVWGGVAVKNEDNVTWLIISVKVVCRTKGFSQFLKGVRVILSYNNSTKEKMCNFEKPFEVTIGSEIACTIYEIVEKETENMNIKIQKIVLIWV